MTTIHIFAQLLVIVLAFSFFAVLFYEIGKWREGKRLTYEFSEAKEEAYLDGYAKGRKDSDNWWIGIEEESESFLATQHGSGENALGWVPSRKTQ